VLAHIADLFELDPHLIHLNHGAFGAVARSVRDAQDRARAAVERAPMRAFRDELPAGVGAAREAAAAFVGVPADAAALVRNVSEGVGVVLSSLGIGPGDEVVVSTHGYPTATYAVQSRGASVRTGAFGLDADPGHVVAALAAAVTDRTRLVIVDHITSPTALVLPVAEVAAAVAPVPVLVDAAHVPGALPGVEVEALGVDFWVGNLHKWAHAPAARRARGAAYRRRRASRWSPSHPGSPTPRRAPRRCGTSCMPRASSCHRCPSRGAGSCASPPRPTTTRTTTRASPRRSSVSCGAGSGER
jgi:isopenicillin-N epimerase